MKLNRIYNLSRIYNNLVKYHNYNFDENTKKCIMICILKTLSYGIFGSHNLYRNEDLLISYISNKIIVTNINRNEKLTYPINGNHSIIISNRFKSNYKYAAVKEISPEFIELYYKQQNGQGIKLSD